MSTSSAPRSPEDKDGYSSRPAFYGRRRGKTLRRTPRALLDTLLPRLVIPCPAEGELLDPRALFPGPVRAVWLEIGFGGGEHLADQALAHPDVGIIGCEVFLNGIASLLGHVEAKAIDNVRIFPDDARRLFPALPPASMEKVFLLFPDPWPKKRHAERRFISPANLDEIARLLVDGGELRVASDDPGYVEWTLRHVGAHACFAGPDGDSASWRERPADWPPTRYEAKALEQGRTPGFLLYHRRSRTR